MNKLQFKEMLVSAYKHDRLYGRNKSTGWSDDYGDAIVNSAWKDFQENGTGLISRHEYVTGKTFHYNKETK